MDIYCVELLHHGTSQGWTNYRLWTGEAAILQTHELRSSDFNKAEWPLDTNIGFLLLQHLSSWKLIIAVLRPQMLVTEFRTREAVSTERVDRADSLV